MSNSDSLIAAAKRLRRAVNKFSFAPPVSHVYNPLDYAWAAHELYLHRYGNGQKRVLFLGMNPGTIRDGADRNSFRSNQRRARLARHRNSD